MDPIENDALMRKYNDHSYCTCVVVAEFMEGPLLTALEHTVKGTDGAHNAWGFFLRARAWMETLGRLNNPKDLQATTTAARSLLETVVDLVLIAHDVSGDWLRKMRAWEDSAKLHQARICSGSSRAARFRCPRPTRSRRSLSSRTRLA